MTDAARQRIDKWLFFTRVVKSRSLAAKIVQAGKVRLNREKIDQAAHNVKPGDVLTVTLDRRILVLKVVAPGTRRGPAEEARTLYEDLSSPLEAKLPAEVPTAERDPGTGRPTKRERRAIDRFEGRD
ncbi:RNA-binding S4 domain-containing protein [Aliihoeflea aestuarii]|jgi:ribosome-associated heat shock protein Hsp15|uniref:RNA-binding S4 domain-containing protein n=1 Tax=Aliihoeflea aestuarii TaxID=453840 RepID=UPI002093F3D2|nr:RNA-binding S4 domain-containing protein [Aliihoeflea aestuarii]MCO6391209.1 RNA-binding S4 domain-containing protein [Aliihoeflea aestuarii]